MHFGRNYIGVVYEPGVAVEGALTPGSLRKPPDWVSLDLLWDLWRSPPPYSDCTGRGILAFALLAFIGRHPSFPRGFRHQHPRLSQRRGRMKSESRGRRAEGAAKRAACLLLLNPQWPRGLSPRSEDPVLNFQLKSGPPEGAAAPTRPPLPAQSPLAPPPRRALQ